MTDQSKRTPRMGWINVGRLWDGFSYSELAEQCALDDGPEQRSLFVREVTGEPTFSLSEILPLVEAIRRESLQLRGEADRIYNEADKLIAQFQKLMESRK